MADDTNRQSDSSLVSIELGVSRRKLMKQLSAVGLLGGATSLSGCSGLRGGAQAEDENKTTTQKQGSSKQDLPDAMRVPLTPPPTADEMDLSNPSQEERQMVFISHVVNEFFIPAIAGMNDGLHKNGWKGQFIGPTKNNPTQQVEALNTTVNRLQGGQDVLATTVLDKAQYLRPVKNAVDQGIPVLQFNTTVDAWDFDFMMENFGTVLPYAGQKFVRGGVAVGLTGYDRARKMKPDEELVMLPTIAVPGHPALSERVEGFRMAFEAQENTKVLDTLNITNNLSKAISRVESAYSSNPEIDVILGSGWWGPVAGGRLVKSQNLQDKLVVGGFDLPEPTLEGIKNGNINFTGGQDPYSQGYQPTQLAWAYMERGIPMKDYITGLSIIDQSNIDFAMQRSGHWDELRDWQKQNYSV